MIAPTCHLVDKHLDYALAEKFGWNREVWENADANNKKRSSRGINPYKIASLRSLYDDMAKKKGIPELIPDGVDTRTLSQDQIDDIYKKLINFRSEITIQTRDRMRKGVKHVDRCWDKLRHAYSLDQRRSRVSLLSNLFSEELDYLVDTYPAGRQYLLDGFKTVTGEMVGGTLSILDGVYNKVLHEMEDNFRNAQDSVCEKAFHEAKAAHKLDYSGAPETVDEYKELCLKRAKEYRKVLENWNELLPFVLKDLQKKEGVKLGIKKEYAVAASSDSFGENDLAAKWDISEAKRDGWQENSDLQSAYGSVGQQVRRILASIPEVESFPEFEINEETGRRVYKGLIIKPVVDDLGNPKYIDPVKTHQALSEFLRGIKDSDDMMDRLCKSPGEAKIPWMQPIVDALLTNNEARTQFFVDFKKNFQPYSVMFEDKKESTGFFKTIKTRLLNKPVNVLKGRYEMSMTARGKHPANCEVWEYDCIFSEGDGKHGGYIDFERLAEVRQRALRWVVEKEIKDEDTDKKDDDIFKNGKVKTYGVSKAPLTDRDHDSFITIEGKTIRASQAIDEKREFLMDVFTSLGIDVNVDTIDSILFSKDIYAIREQLEYLFDPTGNTGILYVLDKDLDGDGKARGHLRNLSRSNASAKEKEEAIDYFKKHSPISYKSLYSAKKKNSKGEVFSPVEEHIGKILEIINKYQEGSRLESRVRYNGNTMYSFVAPSYLGDRLETIQSFVENNDKNGLKQFIKDEYLESPLFVDDEYLDTNGKSGHVLNFWLSEILNACDNKNVSLQDSVAAIFTYERDLGRDDKKFEDFTSKEHAIDMLIHFFADEQQQKGYGGKGTRDINKKLSAMYPVFILGDAGVSKYIRAPRITSAVKVNEKGETLPREAANFKNIEYKFDDDTQNKDDNAQNRILEQFYNIYLQEKRRMALDEAASLQMYANGKRVKHTKGQFSILTFLNEDSQEYNEKYRIPDGSRPGEADLRDNKDFVIQQIRAYLTDAAINGLEHIEANGRVVKTPSFLQRLENLGVLETGEKVVSKNKKVKAYRHIGTIAAPENIESKVLEFFWNTKLATAQQLQIMTIDPSFYHGTKDLQKRYKEIHAPGSVLDIKAKDFDGNYYSADGIERVVYFEDLSINAEDFNPEFMEVILRTFAQAEKEKVEEAIKNGVLKPKQDKGEETKRIDTLKELLGSNYGIYDSYTANTLTDGQGYRTLESYRRVKGMAGQWTIDMENAYKAIMRLRENLKVTDPRTGKVIEFRDATPEELEKIGKFALVLQPIKPYLFTHEKYEVRIDRMRNGKPVIGLDGKPEKIKTYKYIPVQHKYAEALIIPELMPKGHKLRDIGYWMDDNNIDMIGSTKINKVGCFNQCDLQYKTDDNYNYLDKDGNIIPEGKSNKDFKNLAVKLDQNKDSILEAMSKGYVHELPYRDYRIQTNVPEHINASQLFGTQVRKLIMAGLDLREAGEYYRQYLEGIGNFKGTVNLSTDKGENNSEVSLNGRNLLALYNSLICANIMDSYDKFADNAGDIESLADMLQQSTVGSMREAMDNLFSFVVTGNEEGFKNFLIPLFEGGLEHDTAALILSTFKKIVNKQQISGGSAVQVSAFGIKGYEEDGDLRFIQDPDDNSNILYAEIEMPFDKTFTINVKNSDGSTTKQTVNIPFDKYCNPDGTLIPVGDEIPKTIEVEGEKKTNPEWKKYQSYTYKNVNGKWVPCSHKDPQAKVLKPLIEQDYPDILSILAYRIPTERDYSMINCRIKRFTSKTAGGTLKVPPQGTTIAGFDFDIDKLYFMQREYCKSYKDGTFEENNFSHSQVEDIWKKFYGDNTNIQKDLKKARAEAEAANPELITEETYYDARGRKKQKITHHTRLNSYWDAAKIEEKYGKKKGEAFAQTAQTYGFVPELLVKKGEVYERWTSEYDFSETPENNSRAARNNLLISLIQARLMDPQTTKQRYTPGGFAKASEAARFMRELFHGDLDGLVDAAGNVNEKEFAARNKNKDSDPEPNYDPTDPYTILVYNQQNQIAGKLIGIFANQNTNHAFASSMDKFELIEAIAFCGHNFKDLLHKGNPEKAAEIDLNMAEFLAASVDAVKDPVLNFLNLNTITADAGAVLARLGYSTKEIGLLFNQPIIRRLCEDALNSGAKPKTIITNLREKLSGYLTNDNINTSDINISEELLVQGIVQHRRNEEEGKKQEEFMQNNAKTQLAVLDLFEHILEVSTDVSDFVLNTKFTASNAVSSTFGGLYNQQMRVDKYVDKFPRGKDHPKGESKGTLSYKVTVVEGASDVGLMDMPIDNDEKYLNMTKEEYLHQIRFNPFAYEQAMYDTNRKALRLLCEGSVDNKGKKRPGYFPYEKPMYKKVRKRLQELCRSGILSEDDINDIHAQIPVALLAKQENSAFNGEAAHIKNGERMNLTNREYYKERFASDLEDMLHDPLLADLDIFRFLHPVQDYKDVYNPEKGKKEPVEYWRIAMQDVGGMGSDIKEEIRESWAYLMEVNDDGSFKNPQYAQLGRDLFMYCFYQAGFDFSPISFMHLAPTAVKDNIVVPRNGKLNIKRFNEYPKPNTKDNPSNDVYVWSANVDAGREMAVGEFNADPLIVNELSGEAFQLPEELDAESVRKLVQEAKSHPELRFKICRDLDQDEFDLFNQEVTDPISGKTSRLSIPSNIYFYSETLANVSAESQEMMNYGTERSYRQLLYEVLDGTEDSLNDDDFAQMFLLNNLNNYKFVFDITNRGSERLNEIFEKGILKESGNSQYDISSPNGYRKSIRVDISKYLTKRDSDAIGDLAKIETDNDGHVIQVTWAPIIVINNAYYMARSGSDLGFNMSENPVITYVKVEPWGTSKEFFYDNGQKINASMKYQSSIDAIPQRNLDYKEPESPKTFEEITKGNSSQTGNDNGISEDLIANSSEVLEVLDKIKSAQGDTPHAKMQEQLNKMLQIAAVDEMGIYKSIRELAWPNDTSRDHRYVKLSDDLLDALAEAIYNRNIAMASQGSNVNPESSDNSNSGNGNINPIEMSRQEMEDEIFNAFVNQNPHMQQEDKAALKNDLKLRPKQDLIDTVKAIRAEHKDGENVKMKDDKGNDTIGC